VFTDQLDEKAASATSSHTASLPAARPNGDALGQAARRARSRAVAAQATLFDAVNQSLLDELRGAELERLSPEEIRAVLINIRQRIV
jgi:hypothetical protein